MSLPAGLLNRPFAHRGLWSPHGPPENSLAALAAAARAGYGVEFDVRLTRDGVPEVLHDEALERMTGAPGRLADHRFADLAPLRLASSDQPIPTLRQALAATAGAFRLIELKAPADPALLGPAVTAELDNVEPSYAVISFDPALLAWFARERPELPRGLDWEADPAGLAEAVEAARARFLLLDLPLALGSAGAAWREQGLPVIAWTVRTAEQLEQARAACDNLIFEGLRP